jgi:uncharacterized phage protein gp47/JayE
MLIPRPSYDEIFDNLTASLNQLTGIDGRPESSMAGAILRVFASELTRYYDRQEELEKSAYLSTATGEDLNRIGALFGVNRIRNSVASTLGLARAIQFTNNGQLPVNIALGTRVWPANTPEKAYTTTESLLLAAGAQEVVHVRATGEGAFYNAGVREINRHSAPYTEVSVTNVLPLSNGKDVEPDDSYRFRIQQEITRREGLNEDNLLAYLRGLSGVKEALVLPQARGAGTVDVIVVTYQQDNEFTVLDHVQSMLDEILPVGISTLANLPRMFHVWPTTKLY